MMAAAPIHVLVVDDQQLMRDGLRALLELEEGIAVVGEASDGLQALAQAKALAPDVVLMDVRMPRMNGVEATRALRDQGHPARVLVLTTFDDDQYVFDALRAGAAGYILKDIPVADLAAAIRNVQRGGVQLEPSVAAKVIAQWSQTIELVPTPPDEGTAAGGAKDPLRQLTPREQDVVRLIAQGASNREIATLLSISEGTVKNHVANILNRLGLRDRTQVALHAKEHFGL